MKTERRHELKTNTLADWLGHQIESIRPHLTLIISVVVVAVVAIVGFNYWRSSSREAAADAWTAYFDQSFTENTYARTKQELLRAQAVEDYRDQLRKEKNDPNYELTEGETRLVEEQLGEKVAAAMRDDMAAIARNNEGTDLGMLASMRTADLALAAGVNALFPSGGEPRDLKQAATLLDDAVMYYERALEQIEGSPLIERRIRFGLARAYEARNAQDPQREENDDKKLAIAQYQKLSTGDDVFASAARAQLRTLENKDNMYTWYTAMLTPGTESNPTNSNLVPGQNPFDRFHSDLPGASQMPRINFDDTTDPVPGRPGQPSGSNP